MPRRTVNVGLRNAAIMNGEEDLSDWDMEELRRGRRRDKHGGWRGKDPKIVPKLIFDEWVSRQFEEVHKELASASLPAVQRLSELATHPGIDPETQLKAIAMIMDRVFGKPTENVSIQAKLVPEEPWQTLYTDSIVALPSPAGDDVLDAEVVEDG